MHWVPRILCVLAIILISMFAFDSFSSEHTFLQNLGGLIVQLIPSVLLIGLLIVAWKRELAGGIIFILIGILLSPFIYNHNYRMNHSVLMSLDIILMITVPFIIVGILFIVSHTLKGRKNNSE
jgi:hypothetical protein